MLNLTNVSHVFEAGDGKSPPIEVLGDVSVEIPEGSFTSLLGPSGCGKTTLLRMIDGLIRPMRGEIAIHGKPITKPGVERAMVFQEFALLPWRSALKNVGLGLEIQGKPAKETKRIAEQVLRLVNLEGFEGYAPYQLSGGMKQRVGLARALATGAPVLLMDEPFGALDPQIREVMQIELMKLLEQDHKTVVFVTHSIEEAVLLSDQIVVFTARPGRVKEIVSIELPRPRSKFAEELRVSQDMASYRQRIGEMLRPEISVSVNQ